MVGVQVRFCPRDNRTYEALIPVYVDDPENPDNDPEEPYLHIEVQVRHGAVGVLPWSETAPSLCATPPLSNHLSYVVRHICTFQRLIPLPAH